MNQLFIFSLTVFTGFFAIMNPIANTPFFLSLVQENNIQQQKKIAKKSCITAFFIVTIFVVLGKYIFELFNLTIPAFKIAGGLLLFYVGFEMLMSQKSKVNNLTVSDDNDSVAFSPLAIPILAGPGTIVTAMNSVATGGFVHLTIVILVFALIAYLNFLAFTSGTWLVNKIGHNIITVIGKLMGLILTIIATGMVIQGIQSAF